MEWLAVLVIATIKVLGLRARDALVVAAAARRVVQYVEGVPSRAADVLAGYYADSGGEAGAAGGFARGSAAVLVGLGGRVSGEQLHRVLTGRHAATGRVLVPVRGSSGRARGGGLAGDLGAAPEVMTLAQAARIAGVSAAYLRRLAEDYELEAAAANTPDDAFAVDPAGDALVLDSRPRRDRLAAFRDEAGRRWLVTRQELGRFLLERQPPTVVIGYDLVCSAPKSVSLMWAFGDVAMRADAAAALDAGVEAAVEYLERYGAVGTVGGRNRPGLGLAVASYRHEISRSEEAHLHVHNIIANAVAVPVLDDAGRPVVDEHGVARVEWRALDGEVLLAHVKTAGFIGAAALRHELTRRRGVAWGPVRNGVAELAAFPPMLLEAFSTRHAELTDEFAQLVDAGFTADAGTLAAAQRGSRAAKRVLSDPQVGALQRAKLADAGWSVAAVRALATGRRDVGRPAQAEVDDFFDRLTGAGGLTEKQPLFTQREVHQQIAAWAVDRLDAAGVHELARRFLTHASLVRLRIPARRRRNQDEDTYTTGELLEVEDALVALYRQGLTTFGGTPRARITPELAEAAIDAVNGRLRLRGGNPRAGLSGEQCDLVRRLLDLGDLVRPVVGPAGTGKTEAMRALVHAFTAAGYAVRGTANGGRQAEELHERLQIRAEVVTSWLTRLDNAPDPGEIWPPGTVVVVDEATQVSTRDAERLLRYAARTGTVLILVGDPAQLGAVGAGGWFRHLTAAAVKFGAPVPGLHINQRQTGPDLRTVRRALAALRPALPDADREALSLLARDHRLAVFDSRAEMLAAVVRDWGAERRRAAGVSSTTRLGERSRMMAEHHRDTELLNRAARACLAEEGALTGPVLTVAGRQFQLGDEVITLTQAGHTLVPAGAPRAAYIRTGTIGVVTGVHTDPVQVDHQALTVRFPGHGDVRVGWDYLTHSFPDGRDGGLAHAYALTAHKAEGTTMPIVRGVVTDTTSRAGLYVMLSRAKTDLRGYLIRRRDLDADLDDETWLPVVRDTDGPVRAILDHLTRSRPERLATEYDPIAREAHQLANQHTLAELARRRRAALAPDASTAANALMLRRAELAAEARAAREAIADPGPDLLARIGPRPASGPHLALWERAVAATAVCHARHGSGTPLGKAESFQELAWAAHRVEAVRIAARWAAQLRPTLRHRFHTAREAVPRDRAVTGIHALLAAGWSPPRIHRALAEDTDDVQAGAAVLDHRVHRLLDTQGITPDVYRLPAPETPAAERAHATRLLAAAEVRHLAMHPTVELTDQFRLIADALTEPGAEGNRGVVGELRQHRARTQAAVAAAVERDRAAREHVARLERTRGASAAALAAIRARAMEARTALADARHLASLAEDLLCATGNTDGRNEAVARLRQRADVLDAALSHQVDAAIARLDQQPPAYVTGLLGDRPQHPTAAARWRQHAVTIERYRHRVLGLPYDVPAAPAVASAVEQAVGRRPANSAWMSLYDDLASAQGTLELTTSL